MTLRPALYELLTGEPADPAAHIKAAIAVAQIRHAKRIDHINALQSVVHRQLEACCNG